MRVFKSNPTHVLEIFSTGIEAHQSVIGVCTIDMLPALLKNTISAKCKTVAIWKITPKP